MKKGEIYLNGYYDSTDTHGHTITLIIQKFFKNVNVEETTEGTKITFEWDSLNNELYEMLIDFQETCYINDGEGCYVKIFD